MKRIYYLLIMLLAVSFTACEEDEDSPTQTGSGTMVAKVNGKPWRHNGGGGVMGGGAVHVAYNPATGFFTIGGIRDDDEGRSSIDLRIVSVKQTGEYVLRDEANGTYGSLRVNKERIGPKYYFTAAASPGRVTITKLDGANKIISGTFSFRAQTEPDENGGAETVEVTEGWFDVKYR
ncbi:DUF6252 family protein [Rufibacter roseus]|uniref:DUF6252 family protein n=1 Tax=Rufibacter roseus TaxID=1567108 RepID=A0ABW2DE58_9BACT|nr:DUF6252 family protein [Rufibacter roseus]